MNILIVGASGLVGFNVYQHLSVITDWRLTGTFNNYEVYGLTFFEASEKEKWPSEILSTHWDVIIHTAALTNVDKCEIEPELSKYLTIKSTQNLVDLAKSNCSKLIYISTDYVFDGKSGPYIEGDETNPLNVYGRHKLMCEEIIKNNLSDYLILRVTGVFGNEIRGKNFIARIITQIKDRTQIDISAPSDQFATPINALDIAKAIFVLIRDNKGGLYHLSSTDFLSRVQLLQRINSYFGHRLIIHALTTDELSQAATRPLQAGLIARRFLSEYPDFQFTNVDDFIKNII